MVRGVTLLAGVAFATAKRGMLEAACVALVLVLAATAQARQGVPAREWLSTLRFTVLHLDIPINDVGVSSFACPHSKAMAIFLFSRAMS